MASKEQAEWLWIKREAWTMVEIKTDKNVLKGGEWIVLLVIQGEDFEPVSLPLITLLLLVGGLGAGSGRTVEEAFGQMSAADRGFDQNPASLSTTSTALGVSTTRGGLEGQSAQGSCLASL